MQRKYREKKYYCGGVSGSGGLSSIRQGKERKQIEIFVAYVNVISYHEITGRGSAPPLLGVDGWRREQAPALHWVGNVGLCCMCFAILRRCVAFSSLA